MALSRSLFRKGANFTAAMTFEIASTNLVIELGIILAVLMGWQFTLAEYLGGTIMIVLMAAALRLFVSPRLERRAREHARSAEAGHRHHPASEPMPLRERITSSASWSDVAHNFRGDWQMLWKEITFGFLIAGSGGQGVTALAVEACAEVAGADLARVRTVAGG